MDVSKGTYVRSLATDLAERLGTVAHVRELRRPGVAGFEEAPMYTLEELADRAEEGAPGFGPCGAAGGTGLSPTTPVVRWDAEAHDHLIHGRKAQVSMAKAAGRRGRYSPL